MTFLVNLWGKAIPIISNFLEKARKSSKLVPKKVMVTRDGTTFPMTVWVDPTGKDKGPAQGGFDFDEPVLVVPVKKELDISDRKLDDGTEGRAPQGEVMEVKNKNARELPRGYVVDYLPAQKKYALYWVGTPENDTGSSKAVGWFSSKRDLHSMLDDIDSGKWGVVDGLLKVLPPKVEPTPEPEITVPGEGQREATHYGICQECGRMQMLPGGRMAQHGYTLEDGWRSGVCEGSGHKPFEVDKSFTESSITRAETFIEEQRKLIAQGDTHRKFVGINMRTKELVERLIPRINDIAGAQSFADGQKKRLIGWAPRPLTPINRGRAKDQETGLPELNVPEDRLMKKIQAEATEDGYKITWRFRATYSGEKDWKMAAKMIDMGYLEKVRSGSGTDGRTLVVKVSDRGRSKYPVIEKPIRGGKMVQVMWERLKAEGEIKTTPGKSSQWSAARDLAESNQDRVELVETNYDGDYVVIRLKK